MDAGFLHGVQVGFFTLSATSGAKGLFSPGGKLTKEVGEEAIEKSVKETSEEVSEQVTKRGPKSADDLPTPSPTKTPTGKKWKPGDDPHAPTRVRDTPSDSTVRRREWKNEAENPTRLDYTPGDMEHMRKGKPPRRYNQRKKDANPHTDGMESMEKSHEPIPKRDGGRETVPRWPEEHRDIDRYRRINY